LSSPVERRELSDVDERCANQDDAPNVHRRVDRIENSQSSNEQHTMIGAGAGNKMVHNFNMPIYHYQLP
jgi:hypothetical protein